MTTKFWKLGLVASVAFGMSACGAPDAPEAEADSAPEPEIGSSLNEKVEIAVADIPADVMAVAKAARPDLDFREAEREVKNGVTYYDIEGVDAEGNEMELDIVEDGDGWKIVEIQRDITVDQLPEAVSAVLFENAPGIEPARIIESDQGDGIIIYEVYTRSEDGTETKYEVKYDGETAEFLTEEWEH